MSNIYLNNGDGEASECGYLTKKEVANRLRKSTKTIEHWSSEGFIPFIKIKRSVLYRWNDVDSALSHFSSKGGVQ